MQGSNGSRQVSVKRLASRVIAAATLALTLALCFGPTASAAPLQPELAVDVVPGPSGSDFDEATVFNGQLYFVSDDPMHGEELWRSDGDTAQLFADIYPGNGDSQPEQLTVAGPYLYFVAFDGDHGVELWRTDGSTAGTIRLSDAEPGPDGSNPNELVALGDKLIFTAENDTYGAELWTSDGTVAGTTLVKDIFTSSSSS